MLLKIIQLLQCLGGITTDDCNNSPESPGSMYGTLLNTPKVPLVPTTDYIKHLFNNTDTVICD